MKNIHITINGPLNSGKSTVALAIAAALRGYGFEVDTLDDSPFCFPEQQDMRLTALPNKTRIVIAAVSTREYP
jgi:uridine kinase